MIELAGAVDLHVHSAPDVYERSVTDLELAREAQQAGMRALLLKNHHTLTADRAALVAQEVKMDLFGGLVLNLSVGGLNPVAVEMALAFGARQIWMPTVHGRGGLPMAASKPLSKDSGRSRPYLQVIDESGGIKPEVDAILEQIRDADVILGTGHLAPDESLILLERAAGMGVRRLLVTHPLMSMTRFTRDQMLRAVELGAVMEFVSMSCNPKWHDPVSPAVVVDAIRSVGYEHAVLTSDGGQAWNPHPPVMLRDFGSALAQGGIPPEHLERMMCRNPSDLLYP